MDRQEYNYKIYLPLKKRAREFNKKVKLGVFCNPILNYFLDGNNSGLPKDDSQNLSVFIKKENDRNNKI